MATAEGVRAGRDESSFFEAYRGWATGYLGAHRERIHFYHKVVDIRWTPHAARVGGEGVGPLAEVSGRRPNASILARTSSNVPPKISPSPKSIDNLGAESLSVTRLRSLAR